MSLKVKGKTLLILVTGAGIVVTAYLAAKKAPEAQKRKEEALKAKREATGDENAQLTTTESIKAQIGSYAPAIISGVVAFSSFIGTEIIDEHDIHKIKQSVTNDFNKLKNSLDDYKTMTDKLNGNGSSKIIERAIEQDNKTFTTRQWYRIIFEDEKLEFQSTPEDVIKAFYEANRQFQGTGILTFNEFLDYLDQQLLTDEAQQKGEELCWEAFVCDNIFGYTWLDFDIQPCEDRPDMKEIIFPVMPRYIDEDDQYHKIDEACAKKITDGDIE